MKTCVNHSLRTIRVVDNRRTLRTQLVRCACVPPSQPTTATTSHHTLCRRQILQWAPTSAIAIVLNPLVAFSDVGEQTGGLVLDLTEEERLILEYNQRIAVFNRAPRDFPSFIRNGYQVRVLTKAGYVEQSNGLIYKDYEEGTGDYPQEGQQVVFNYTAYNESGATIDSTYRQGRPAETRLGIGGMIPGFEEGIKGMKVGGKRRVVVPPELGPPVGPSTFFSSRQFEVFDVELISISNCERKNFGIISRVVCEKP